MIGGAAGYPPARRARGRRAGGPGAPLRRAPRGALGDRGRGHRCRARRGRVLPDVRASARSRDGWPRSRLPEGVSPAELTEPMLEAMPSPAPATSARDGVRRHEFRRRFEHYFASSGCASTTWQVPNVGATWNDRFESGKGSATCDRQPEVPARGFRWVVRVACTPNCATYGIAPRPRHFAPLGRLTPRALGRDR